MLHAHLCSALCATGLQGCCGIENADSSHCKNECCKKEKDNDGKQSDCQDTHASFFKTTGQFASEKSDDAIKFFQSLIAVITPSFTILPVEKTKDIFVYTGFHPPPPKADIRIAIRSFQI